MCLSFGNCNLINIQTFQTLSLVSSFRSLRQMFEIETFEGKLFEMIQSLHHISKQLPDLIIYFRFLDRKVLIQILPHS